ncbi:MAG: acyl-CoA dehydrogenase family protein [Solirubrobacteraceae bacterium]
MNPFSPEHDELRDSIRRFVAAELRPNATEWENARWFPNDVFTRMGELGFLGLKYPEAYGGQGGDYLHDAVLTEELSLSGSGGVAAGIGAHIGIATPPIWKFGTEDQKQRFLAPAIKGERIAALGITEPDAGSDVAGIKTRATRVDGGWTLSGSKMFITNGVRADFVVTAAKTTAEGGHHGISFFLVETDQPGYEASKIEKMGWHASDTALISLDEAFVPDENLLGGENEGFKLIMANFQWERLLMSLGAVSAMQAAFDKTVQFVADREAFGRPIGKFQVLKHRLADHATTIHAARTVTYDALARFAGGEDVVKEVTMAKLITQRSAFDLIDDCLQMHGGAGYMVEYDIERAARDSRLGPIGGGTDEIMREILSKVIGL